MLKRFQLLRNDILLPTALLLNHCWFSRRIEVSFTWGTDTLIVLHCIDVPKSNPFCQLYVGCSDTDVLLLSLYFHQQICNNTIFHAITWEIDVGCAYNVLGNEKSKELLGVYAFTGCDLTGRFSGFSKTTYLDTFLKSNSIVHKAFA